MKKKKENKNRIFLPFLISIVVTILFFYFSMLFVEDYRDAINYVFIGLIYTYIYVNLYNLFNNRYIFFLEKYVDILKKMKIVNKKYEINNSLVKKDKSYDYKLMFVYMLTIICIISLLLFIWQMILEIEFIYFTSITCFAMFILTFISSILILIITINNGKRKNKKKC